MDKIVILSGFAIFAIFFGSGNLMFPIGLGAKNPGSYISGLVGLLLADVVGIIIALIAAIRFNGVTELFFDKLRTPFIMLGNATNDYKAKSFFKLMEKVPLFLFLLLTLSMLGPFGITPRSIWVSFGGLELMGVDKKYLLMFAIPFITALGLLIWKREKVMDRIAKFLTPIKFTSLSIVIIAGVLSAPSLMNTTFELETFKYGVMSGYQMMDLFGITLIAQSVISYLKQKKPNATDKDIFKFSLQATILGGSLIAVVYSFLTVLGAAYSKEIASLELTQMLPYIAKQSLGKNFGLPLISFVLTASCLVTCVFLTNCFVNFIKESLDKVPKIGKLFSYEKILIPTLILSTVMAMVGFQTIFNFLGSILTYVYPFLIAYYIYTLFLPRPLIKK